MKRSFFTILLFTIIQGSLLAQDTTWVQTLAFDSVTTRRGTWDFPEEQNWRKVLMYYTLKCDILTQHDQYECGEWDYLTYTNFWEHTGEMDSTTYYQSTFSYIGGKEVDELPITTQPTHYYFTSRYNNAVFQGDTITQEEYEIGNDITNSNEVFDLPKEQQRTLFLWTADELDYLPAEAFNSLQFNFQNGTADINNVTIKLMLTDSTLLDDELPLFGLEEVFSAPVSITEAGWKSFNFHTPFSYDGTSNLLVEVAIDNPEGGTPLSIAGESITAEKAILCNTEDYAIDFRGECDFVQLPADVYFDSDFVVSFWFYKRTNANWSRVLDFGNGANADNVLIAFTSGTSGKMSFNVRQGTDNKGFTTVDAFPLHEWTHITLRLANHIGWVYINGELYQPGQLQQPNDIVREKCYLGRSNWSSDNYANALLNDFRIWTTDIGDENVRYDVYNSIEDPASNTDLESYYNFDNDTETTIIDASSFQREGTLYGMPRHTRIKGEDLKIDYQELAFRPTIKFMAVETTGGLTIVEEVVIDSLPDTPVDIVFYEDDATPTIPNDTIRRYQAGYKYVMDGNSVYDSVYIEPEEVLMRDEFVWYGEPFEVIDRWEIARFITPYGINLDLGPEGFTWVYDVTDYEQLLQGEVDFSAGNQQELIDVRFAFISGTPPREVIDIQRPWGNRASYSYSALDNDTRLSPVDVQLDATTAQVKLIARLTGHGHNSTTGNYPHCCEWKDNTHYMKSNGNTIDEWHIWQTHDCGLNPVFPQGGTWPGAREGWCPGDRVADHEIELTPYVVNQSVNIDYAITPVPATNLGMGNGNYVVSMHVIEYGENIYTTDAELYQVIMPNNERYFSRKNPLCSNPKVVIRNNGTSTLTSTTFTYGISSFDEYTYEWTGEVAPNALDTIDLPATGSGFWLAQNDKRFYVTVSNPNNLQDEYADNDTYYTTFSMPDLIDEEEFVLYLKMNNEPWRFNLVVYDDNNNVMFSREDFEANETYLDTLCFPLGCYTLLLTDTEDMGLYYWAYGAGGNGQMRLQDLDGNILKSFESEFGHELRYSFTVGEHLYINDSGQSALISLFPNPAHAEVNVTYDDATKIGEIALYDLSGKQVWKGMIAEGTSTMTLETSSFECGLYIVRITNNGVVTTKKMVIQ